jgi:hypothetical protein
VRLDTPSLLPSSRLHLGLDCVFAVGKFLFSMQRYPTPSTFNFSGTLTLPKLNVCIQLTILSGFNYVRSKSCFLQVYGLLEIDKY